MKKYNLFILLSSIFFIVGCDRKNISRNQNPSIDSTLETKHQWLKDYALCACIKYSFKNDTSIKNDISFGIYANISDYNNTSIYRTIDSMSRQTAYHISPTQIADYQNKKPLLLGCIEYYHSRKLDSIIKSFDYIFINKH